MAFIYGFTDTWNSGATTFDAIKVDVTDTASNAASLLLNLSVGGSVKMSVRKDGHIVCVTEAIGGATIGTNALAVTGTVNTSSTIVAASTITSTSGNVAAGNALTAQASTGATVIALGSGGSVGDARFSSGIAIAFNSAANLVTGSTDTTISRNAAGVVQFGTTAANASGSWLATNGTLSSTLTLGSGGVGGTLNINNTSGSSNTITYNTSAQWLFGSIAAINAGNGELVLSTASGNTGSLRLGSITAPDTTLSRNAAGVFQFGTTTQNAAGAWLAAKGILTGGTLADQAQVLAITATQPASPSASQYAITKTITSAGSASQTNTGELILYSAGYTGSSSTFAMATVNSAAGTGSSLVPASGSNDPVGNISFSGNSNATTTGMNAGFRGLAEGGNINVGAIGFAQKVKNSATNIGVVGSAINTGTTPVQIGGFFSLNQTTVPTVSAALIADNGAQTDAIFLARDNGTTVFTIADGGAVSTTARITTLGGAAFIATNTALTDGVGASAGTITNAPSIGNPTKWIGINDNGTTRYIPAW